MDRNSLIENIIEQIKELQLKLGFAEETIRLYFPVSSLCSLLKLSQRSSEELLSTLEREEAFRHTVLGAITFSLCAENRMEVRVSANAAVYVHEHVSDPPFLASIIELFQNNHHLEIEEICACFARFSDHYVCEEMEPGADFDYVLYFADQKPDAWYYCVRMEMGHTIYHRFTETDYRSLFC